jgi:hypothetical protein
MSIIQTQIKALAEGKISQHQAGFQKGMSTIKQTCMVKQISVKYWEGNTDIYHIFIDYKQAYDYRYSQD